METKPRSIGKHNVKVNMLHVRASNSDLDILNQRAAAMKMPLSTYMLWQSLKPLGQAVKEKEQQDTNKLNYETCLQIRKELNQQNIDLNQITRSLTGQIHSQPIDRILKDIAEIREINRSISRTIATTSISLPIASNLMVKELVTFGTIDEWNNVCEKLR